MHPFPAKMVDVVVKRCNTMNDAVYDQKDQYAAQTVRPNTVVDEMKACWVC